ncbi:MAG: ABC transporter permease, partial [Neptuniibacter sp.]
MNRFNRLVLSIAPLLVVCACWEIAAQLINSSNLPGVIAVITSLYEHLREGEMLNHLSLTLMRVGISFAIAMLLGVLLGIIMGAFPKLNQGGDSLLVIALNVPALVTILLCYIWFGLIEAAAIAAVAINKIPTVVVMVREGARVV